MKRSTRIALLAAVWIAPATGGAAAKDPSESLKVLREVCGAVIRKQPVDLVGMGWTELAPYTLGAPAGTWSGSSDGEPGYARDIGGRRYWLQPSSGYERETPSCTLLHYGEEAEHVLAELDGLLISFSRQPKPIDVNNLGPSNIFAGAWFDPRERTAVLFTVERPGGGVQPLQSSLTLLGPLPEEPGL